MASKRDLIRFTDEEAQAFLAEQRTVIVATNGRDGWPHLMPLWYVLRPTGPDGRTEIWGWTFGKSQKVRNLERDPRTTLQVESGTEYQELRGLMIEAETELIRDLDAVTELGLEIFTRYSGGVEGELADQVRAMVQAQAAKRVGLRFVERRRSSWDHAKLGGVY